MLADLLKALVLGIVEGVTEFLPVSSTGHLLLVERFMDLDRDNFWKTFAVMIQLGAILAILVIYFGRLWRIALGMFTDPPARRFVIGVLLAFLPAVILGLLFGSFIKNVLFNPWVVCFSLIAGGAVLLWVDQQDFQIVLVNGQTVPQDTRRGHADLLPPFTTYYEQVDGKYWFPTYTRAEGVLHFPAGNGAPSEDVHMRNIVRYTDYKQFRATSRIIYNGEDITNNKAPEADQNKNGQQQNQQQPAPQANPPR